jgi:hypothetical protein
MLLSGASNDAAMSGYWLHVRAQEAPYSRADRNATSSSSGQSVFRKQTAFVERRIGGLDVAELRSCVINLRAAPALVNRTRKLKRQLHVRESGRGKLRRANEGVEYGRVHPIACSANPRTEIRVARCAGVGEWPSAQRNKAQSQWGN